MYVIFRRRVMRLFYVFPGDCGGDCATFSDTYDIGWHHQSG
jgi:hypothetical protein